MGASRIRYMKNVIADTTGKYQLLCANCNWIKRHEMYEQQGRTRVTPV
jgi:Zn-finger protein